MGSTSNIQLPTQSEEERNCTYAMQLLSSSVLPFVLHSTIQLDVFEILAKDKTTKLSALEIVSHIPDCKNPDAATMLDRMLYVLASYSLLDCSVIEEKNGAMKRVYGLSGVGKFFVRNEDGASMGPLLALLQDKVFIHSWFELKDAVLEGAVPFDRVHGVHAFEYPKLDPKFNDVFNKAMINHTTIIMKRILENYKGFESLKSLVDVGGGLGVNLKMITSKYPTIKGINFDLPHVVQHAPSYPGVENVGGDMFESVPEGDAIFMKWILHDWSDSHCLKLLKNCYKALPDNGKVIVVEANLPVQPDTDTTVVGVSQCDLIMMAQNPGGKERSEQEFRALATEAGFKGVNLICCVCNFWVMEFHK
ncbi:Caffeic acid 3-O-methyltransferase [Capsicum annuum]|uniref:Caffeic acid 3-O-methyltransferase n=1 Tax=Capsicum annuum TaxID=4072 RepID=A0A1U8EGG0_CAPAN|nr:caffeic acid 3-O-methyltransferase 1 [Capsicum annuum]KAF3669282.1 Caffeic acid 3-O-methyltransferase [Capsicum annuum]PHT70053.1 Caffeic acid 3-O-methyltransferase [Capsicum annuum]